ncbi:MAG TPA: TIGR04013 family B12-binding domain/radical SAM domain-containing protein [Myxococcaceae bacterium]|jgi:B12-binding domain/radical SAM domain protein
MSQIRPAALVMSYQYPGRYAFNVLAGAVEAGLPADRVRLDFPRDRESMLEAAHRRAREGCAVVAAWSFYSASFPAAAEELRWLKPQLPTGALCVAGGVHATAEPLETLRAGFDLIAVGEGERTVLELLDLCARGEDPRGARGTAHLDAEGRVRSAPRPEPVALDDFPPFAVAHRRFGAIEITRGCIYACRFCQTPFISKARFRHRSIQSIRDGVDAIRRHGIRHDARFISPTSLSYGSPDESVNLPAVEALLQAAREAIGSGGRVYFGTFPSELRPEHVTPEALALIRRYADNRSVIIGGQSGSDQVLARSHRGHGVEAIRRAARVAVECGFVPDVDFILGLPGEGPEEMRQTVALMYELADSGARVHGHTFLPLPGTPFRDAAPGSVDPETTRELDRLAARGQLYGGWKRQVTLARELSERRRHAARERGAAAASPPAGTSTPPGR